jgi:bifunctional non-homologous end joining protein LigD
MAMANAAQVGYVKPMEALAVKKLPEGTVLDGELAALDGNGRPRLGLLQNHRTNHAPIVYFPFDILFHRGEDLTRMTLDKRRVVLDQVCPQSEFVLPSAVMETAETVLLATAHGLEGVVAKRVDSSMSRADGQVCGKDASEPRPGVRGRRIHSP